MWLQCKQGNYTQIAGAQYININYAINSILFTLTDTFGFIHGYVVGDFNNWQKLNEYKLDWIIDPNTGKFKLQHKHEFSDDFKHGSHQYSYILIDFEGQAFQVSADGNEYRPYQFEWTKIEPHLMILASDDVLYQDFPIDLIPIKNTYTNLRSMAEVEWMITPQHPDLSIIDNHLLLKSSTLNIPSILVSCIEHSSGLRAERVFLLNPHKRQGKLLHFFKYKGDYKCDDYEWDVWAYYSDGRESKALSFSNKTDFGVSVLLEESEYVIVRKKTWSHSWHNNWAKQTNAFKIDEHPNQYIVYGDSVIYTRLEDLLKRYNPKILFAVLDDNFKITVFLSHTPPINTVFDVYINQIKQENITQIIKDQNNKVILTNIPPNICPSDLVEIRANNTFQPCVVTMRYYLDSFVYSRNDMGVVFKNDAIALRLWAPTAYKVEVVIYAKDNPIHHNIQQNDQPDICFEMQADFQTGTHFIEISKAEFTNAYYLYRLSFHDIDISAQPYTRITYALDPYANGVSANGNIGVLVNLQSAESKPEQWDNHAKPYFARREDAIIYEMHVRDFTIDKSSGINRLYAGRYEGSHITGSHYTEFGAYVSTGIDSLCELGITHVHLLPIYDFATVDEVREGDPNNRNWGYDPMNYNVPEGSYSQNANDPLLRIKEVRKMVQKFHQKGIRIIIDVVYNHMYNTINFENIVTGYYFRTNYIGRFTNGSGCGNELATERPMVRKFIIDSILHWINTYKIDGLRFDLMELIDLDTMNMITKQGLAIDPSLLIYGEPWKADTSPLVNGTYRGSQRNMDFSIFNDRFRDAIRGSNSPGNGFVNGNAHDPEYAKNIMEGLMGSIHSLTAKSGESINYVDAHDNYTLWDHLEKSQNQSLKDGCYRQGLGDDLFSHPLVRQNLLALGIIMTAQGIPFIQGGIEMLRTKQGDHNSYKSNDSVNGFKWSDKLSFLPVFKYVQGLITLRKQHPAFRMSDPDMIHQHLRFKFAYDDEKSGVIIAHFTDHANGDEWKDILIIYNATAIDYYKIYPFLPPDNPWKLVVNHRQAGVLPIHEQSINPDLSIHSHTMMVFHN